MLEITLETLRKIRDAKAPEGIAYPDTWYEGYARQSAADTLRLVAALVGPKTENSP